VRVTLCGLVAIYIEKYLNAKKEEELWENSNISPGKKYNLPKILYKENPKILSRYYYNSITILKFQHKPKKISSFQNPHIKIDLLFIT
jgi:hypothetical protein